MSRRNIVLFIIGLLVIAGIAGVNVRLSASTPGAAAAAAPGATELKSAMALAFGPDNVLFVGDSQGAAVYAFEVKDAAKDEGTDPIKLDNLDRKIAGLLGVTTEDVVINDLAVHPISQHVYLAVTRGRGNDALPVLLRATKAGAIEEVSLRGVPFSKVSLKNAPAPGSKTSWGRELRPLTITDLAWTDGELLIAGLSTAEFASTLRRAAYPFTKEHTVNTLEVFHTSHDKYDTESPIETFLPITINGKPSLLAGYGCAPIASFPLADLRTKQHLRGTTLAELGGGNRPLDMITFERNGKRRVVIANSDRTLMTMSSEDIDKAAPLTTKVAAAYVSAGVPYVSIAEVGITQIDNLNSKFVVAVQRDIADGSLKMKSLSKNWL